MPTPSIQTLVTDAQQVLNLDSISAVRSVVAVALANANVGTPLNPNMTTQQLWNEFYQVITKPKSDIESIIANQLMKFLFAPPAPGGVGANGQVIFNDGGVLAGDPQLLWDKTTNLLTVTGAATITGDLTVRTNKLAVTSTGVGINGTSAAYPLEINGGASASTSQFKSTGSSVIARFTDGTAETGYIGSGAALITGAGRTDFGIASNAALVFGISTGLGMTLNSTGLGVGVASPTAKLHISGNFKIDGATSEILMATGSERTISASGSSGSTALTFKRWNGSSYVSDFVMDGLGNFISNVTATPPTLGTNSQMVFNLTSNTNLRISVRGTDGTTRTANITLA